MSRQNPRESGKRRVDLLTKLTVAGAVFGAGGLASYFAHEYHSKPSIAGATTSSSSNDQSTQLPSTGSPQVTAPPASPSQSQPQYTYQQPQQIQPPRVRSGGS
jgi:hypothetical protein